jgi:hypothetical protein
MTMPTEWDIAQAKARGPENYYSHDQRMEQHIAEKMAAATAQAAEERTAYDASLEGQLARAQSQQRITGAAMSQIEWDEIHRINGWPAEPKPKYQDLPLNEKAEALSRQLAAASKENR